MGYFMKYLIGISYLALTKAGNDFAITYYHCLSSPAKKHSPSASYRCCSKNWLQAYG
jgi:hypothetical protein